MNKKTLWNVALILLALLAVAISALPNAVTYCYKSGDIVYGSFFTLNEDVTISMCLPVAGLLSGISLMLTVAYCISKKQKFLKGIALTAFAAMFLGAIPNIIQADIRAFPNVVHPIAAGLAYLLAKHLQKEQTPLPGKMLSGERLNNH